MNGLFSVRPFTSLRNVLEGLGRCTRRRQALADRIKSIDWARIASSAGWVVGFIAVVGAVISMLPALLVVSAVATASFTFAPS